MVKAIDLWCRPKHSYAEDDEENLEEHSPDDPDEHSINRPQLKPISGPHAIALCEMCRMLGRGCWERRTK